MMLPVLLVSAFCLSTIYLIYAVAIPSIADPVKRKGKKKVVVDAPKDEGKKVQQRKKSK